jgi:ribosomal protein S18 acetylase RimI-like enzyme
METPRCATIPERRLADTASGVEPALRRSAASARSFGVMDEMSALHGHHNLIDWSGQSTRWGKGGKLSEPDGIVLFATGSWIPVNCNGVFRTDESVRAADVLAEAEHFFRGLGRGYSLKVRDTGHDDDLRQPCQEQGFTKFGEGGPHMICEARLPDVPPPADVEVRVVASQEQLADFVRVNGEAYSIYGMPPEEVAAVFSRPEVVLASPDLLNVVAYAAGEPVGAAQAFLSHGVAGIYWVGTVSNARRRGIGRLCTRAVTNMAFEHGAAACALQASPMGEPIYRGMGYEEAYRYENWVYLPG